MIAVWLADVLRLANVAGALALTVAAGFAIAVSQHIDQRIRFGLFAAFGVLLTSGHLASLGREGTWRLPVLTLVVALAVVSTVIYVRRELRARRGGS